MEILKRFVHFLEMRRLPFSSPLKGTSRHRFAEKKKKKKKKRFLGMNLCYISHYLSAALFFLNYFFLLHQQANLTK